MSNLEDRIEVLLREAFPRATIRTQHSVRYKEQLLIFDFYVPSINTVVECQGRQHYEFVKHFHGNQDGFKQYKFHDQLKKEWAKKNKVTLVEVSYKDEPKTAPDLFYHIWDIIDE
jgi:hypothetical protein